MKCSSVVMVVISFIIFTSGTCKKSGIGCAEISYNFEATSKVVNPMDSIKIGDTIWLEITAPSIQADLISGNPVSYKNASNLGTAIGFSELINPNAPVFAAHEFDYVLVKGIALNSNVVGVKEYRFIETVNSYEFRLGIIPKRKGYFNFGLSNASNVYRENDKCTKAFYRIYFSNTPLHLYFIKDLFGITPDSSYLSPYCFKVN